MAGGGGAPSASIDTGTSFVTEGTTDVKVVLLPRNNSFFSLDFKAMLIKH